MLGHHQGRFCEFMSACLRAEATDFGLLEVIRYHNPIDNRYLGLQSDVLHRFGSGVRDDFVVRRVARNLVHALGIEATGAFTLPAIRTSMRDLVDAIADAAQVDAALATHMPDPGLESAFGRLPPLSTPFATALGFAHDGSLAELVASALATIA